MVIFTPYDEPYLGRDSVFQFDQMIQVAMEQNTRIAPWTQDRKLSRLQRAACQIIPHGFSIALSIRELVRQGYLFSAGILLRPLIERAAVISYLSENKGAIDLWEKGWPHKTRPPLHKMLGAMRGPEKGTAGKNEETARTIVQRFNRIVHADPVGASENIGRTVDGGIGHLSSKSLDDPERCDDVCFQAAMYLIVLSARAIQIFPKAFDGGKSTKVEARDTKH